MSTYEPGLPAVATVRRVEDVRVFRVDGEWVSTRTVDGSYFHADYDVTDVRPLVVLDPSEANPVATRDLVLAHLVETLKRSDHLGNHGFADQIEAQTKPARIPEPGLWGVVEAGHKHLCGRRATFVRTGGRWFDTSWVADYAEWDDLVDPALVREGVDG